MHQLFTQVLNNKDLSKAGDLFSISDDAIVNDLTEVVNTICEITSLPDYVSNDNDQSVVEICITRVTSAIRETNTMEQHAEAMVTLLESCLNHNLKPSSNDEDPPHAKISADIISCIFLNYNKKEVMKRVLPVAVKFLHKGNKELTRNMASYLSLAAVHNANLLCSHIQLIIDSVISGNYPLCRVLPQIYEVTKEPIHDHAMALVSILPLCDLTEKLALLQLFSLIATNMPTLLEASLSQLCEYLGTCSTATFTIQVFLNLAEKRPQLLLDSIPKIKMAAECHPNTLLCLAARVIAAVGRLNREKAQDALNFILKHLPKVDSGSQSMLLREATQLCSSYPILCTDKMLSEVWQCSRNRSGEKHSKRTQSGVTIVKVNAGTTNDSDSADAVVVSVGANSKSCHNMMKQQSSITATNIDVNIAAGQQIVATTTSTTMATTSTSSTTTKTSINLSHRPLSLVQPNNGGFDGGNWLNRQEINRVVITPRLRLIGDSRSTGRLHVSGAHRSMTKLNNGNGSRIGSIGGLHKSMTKLSTNQLNILQPCATTTATTNTHLSVSSSAPQYKTITSSTRATCSNTNVPIGTRLYSSNTRTYCTSASGGVTVTTRTCSPTKSIFGSGSALRDESMNSDRHSVQKYCSIQPSYEPSNYVIIQSDHLVSSSSVNHQTLSRPLSTPGSSPLNQSLILNQSSMTNSQSVSGSLDADSMPVQSLIVSRRFQNNSSNNNNCLVTIVNNKSTNVAASQRISAFEPYPMRDTIQHFCEKHLDKIKAYMEKICEHIPPPAKCTVEERRAKKMVKLHFACQGRGEHCLYNRTFFTMKTRHPRIWIHLMFLTLQARSQSALSSRHVAVTSLKNCWDILKCENRTFLTLVTSAFPCGKDQEILLNELRRSGFCDVFEHGGSTMNLWCCFLCNHPERAVGFLQESQPVIEGQLKEKKGRWKFFKRWRTRYFTLSGAHLSYKESKDDKEGTPIEVHQIRSVKVSRGARNIPKAFEIFTGDQSLILKPKRGENAEEWVQCLSIVVAHSHAKEMPSRSSSIIRGIV